MRIRKMISWVLAFALFLGVAPIAGAKVDEPFYMQLVMNAGDMLQIESAPDLAGKEADLMKKALKKAKGGFENINASVATVSSDGTVTALADGHTLLILHDQKGAAILHVEVKVGTVPVPESVQGVIDHAIQEWEAGKDTRFDKCNKYTQWFRRNKTAKFGWCGAFVSYNFETAGVSVDSNYQKKSVKPLTDGSPFAVRQAAVPKLFEGFLYRNRISHIPEPGYYVIYGERGRTGFIHTGLVTDVQDMGEGVFMLKTVEGNVSNTIKRYCYLYDTRATDPEKNMRPVTPDMQTDPDAFHYELHTNKWYVKAFGQTWY